MKVPCVLALLCVALVYQAECGWWSAATNFVGNAVGAVTRIIGKKERRRELNEQLDEESMKEVDKVCTESHLKELEPDGVPFEFVKLAFEGVDKEGKDALDADELEALLTTLEVFKHCMK